MNAIMQRVDDAMLTGAQKISDVADETFGLDHWSLATGLLRIGLGCILMSTALSLAETSDPVGYVVTVAFSFIWFLMYQGLHVRLRMQKASSDAGRALRVSERQTRIVDLILMGVIAVIQIPHFDLSAGFFTAAITCFHVHYYFKAADLPPPSTSTRIAWNG